MLDPISYKNHIIAWAKAGQWDMVKASASKRAEAMGYITLPMGSLWHIIQKDWFEKAKKLGLIKQNNSGQWLPWVHIDEVQEKAGYRGMTPVFEGRAKKSIRKSDLDALEAFLESHREWEKQNHQELMDYGDVIDAYKGYGYETNATHNL